MQYIFYAMRSSIPDKGWVLAAVLLWSLVGCQPYEPEPPRVEPSEPVEALVEPEDPVPKEPTTDLPVEPPEPETPLPPQGKVHKINGSKSCAGVAPGDTIYLGSKSGTSRYQLSNCEGTKEKPILIVNNPTGKTIIKRTDKHSGDFVFVCDSCKHVVLEGRPWEGMPDGATCPPPRIGKSKHDPTKNGCGIKFTHSAKGASPSHFVRFSGKSSDFTIRNIEVDGVWPKVVTNGIGISVNDSKVKDHQLKWRENITIENVYVHHTEGEGLYIGPNYARGGTPKKDVPLRDIEVANSWIHSTGWDCIEVKSTIGGTEHPNKIHHNFLEDCGIGKDGTRGQHKGISVFEGGGQIYRNTVLRSGETGIACGQLYRPASDGPQPCYIRDNLVMDSGVTGPLKGKNINVGRKGEAFLDFVARVENNISIGSKDKGINVNSLIADSQVNGNVSCDNQGADITAKNKSNNKTGNCSTALTDDQKARIAALKK